MEKVEAPGLAVGVAGIQPLDLALGRVDQCVVFGTVLFGRIGEIAEERKVEVRVAVGQIAYLERIKQAFDAREVAQQGGHDNRGAKCLGDSVFEFEFGQ